MARKHVLMFLTALGWFAQPLLAEPIAPVGLRQLYDEASTVVVAEVLRTEDGEPGFRTPKRAILRVSAILKGPLVGPELAVQYWPDWSCTADAHYEAGQTMLAFLKEREGGGAGYHTCSLSYGAIPLPPDKPQIHRIRVDELKAILTIAERPRRIQEMLNWMLRCIADPATRSSGLLDLHAWVALGSESDQAETTKIEYWRLLSNRHLDELARILQTLDPTRSSTLFEASLLMSTLARKTRSEEMGVLFERYAKLNCNFESPLQTEEQRRLQAEFLSAYASVVEKRRE